MKLKSKLIATIVSMCAAIAVMGVGVWASTSQNFTVTVNNDIDVKIIGVNADVYGEFALYTQFIGHGQATSATTPNAYAAKIGAPKNGITDRSNYDHGYLLYAQAFGYNDGIVGTSDDKNSYGVNNDYGYGKYINEAKNNVFLATKKATLVNSNANTNPAGILNLRQTVPAEGAKQDYTNIYNVDATTHTAQAAYLYTVNQWLETQGNNAIYTTVDVNLSEDLVKRINGTVKDGANAQVRPYLYVGKLTKNADNRENDTIEWRQQTLTVGTDNYKASANFTIPADKVNDNVYYIMLTFTFGRNSANLDLSLLQDALNHTVTMKAEYEGTAPANWNADANTIVNLYSATGATTTNGTYSVEGSLFKPNTRTFESQVNLEATNAQLKNCFALALGGEGADAALANQKLSSLPLGYIYVGTNATNSAPAESWNWLKDLNEGKRTTSFGNGINDAGNGIKAGEGA